MKEKMKLKARHALTNFKGRTKKVGAVLSLVAVMCFMMIGTAFAGEPTPAPTIDSSIFDTIVEGAEKGAHLFTIYPINIFLGASILMMALGVLFVFKKRAKN